MSKIKSTHKRKSMSRRRNSVRVNLRTKKMKRNKHSKRMKKTKRMKINNYEKRGGLRFWQRRHRDNNGNEGRNRPGLGRRTLTSFRNLLNRRRLQPEAEEQVRILEEEEVEEEERRRQQERQRQAEEERDTPKWELPNKNREEIKNYINSTIISSSESMLDGREGLTDYEVFLAGWMDLPSTWSNNNRDTALDTLLNNWDNRPDWIKRNSQLQLIRTQLEPLVRLQESQGDGVAYEDFMDFLESSRE